MSLCAPAARYTIEAIYLGITGGITFFLLQVSSKQEGITMFIRFRFLFAIFLLSFSLLLSSCSKTPANSASVTEFPQQLTFSSSEKGIPIRRITVIGGKLLFDSVGHLIMSNNTPVDLHISFPAYPWEHSGAVEKYWEHSWSHFDAAFSSAEKAHLTFSCLLIYNTSFYLVFEEPAGQLIYSAGGADHLSSVPLAEFFQMLLQDSADSQNSGGRLP